MVTKEALDRLKAAAAMSRPWYMMVGLHKPHTPFDAPAMFYEGYDAASIPLAVHQTFPKENLSGLAYFGCRAIDVQYKMDLNVPLPADEQQARDCRRRRRHHHSHLHLVHTSSTPATTTRRSAARTTPRRRTPTTTSASSSTLSPSSTYSTPQS